ncbi:MAG: hypothetical protein ACYTFQ_27300, partial [Planctomycetota bacterium]
MGYGVQIGRASDTRLVSVYCSNTAAGALNKGYVVALRFTGTTLASTPNEDGTRFGAAVDHAADTNSFVVGVLGGGRSDQTTWANASWGQAVVRGPLASVYASGTVTAQEQLYLCATDGAAYCTDGTSTALRP